MEFKISKEQILEVANWGNYQNEKQIKEWFPEAFKTELETGKWYKGTADFKSLIYITKLEKQSYYNIIHYYGFTPGKYSTSDTIANKDHENSLIEATPEEVEAALKAEAKKRGYKKGQIIKSFAFGTTMIGSNSDYVWKYFKEHNALSFAGDWVFKAGQWAEILPQEKTTISKEKALKILAKKLKISPDNIEIK